MCVGGAAAGSTLQNTEEQDRALPKTWRLCHQHQVQISWDPSQEDAMQQEAQG